MIERKARAADGRRMDKAGDDRRARLAAALRENLRRRKAQTRGRTDAQPKRNENAPAGVEPGREGGRDAT